MKSLVIITAFLLGFTSPTVITEAPAATEGHRLEVRFKGLDNDQGNVRICLMNDPDQFLKDCFVGRIYDFTKNEGLKVVFDDVPSGNYAIMAFHDEDSNGKLNCEGLFGMPSEDYAFSNNPSTLFGPPSHKKCVFSLTEDRAITIKF